MTGHVFHPGHDELHGITVVITTPGSRTWVGRWHERDAHGVHLLDAVVHDTATSADTRDAFLTRVLKFGVRPEHKHVLLPPEDVGEVVPLRDLSPG